MSSSSAGRAKPFAGVASRRKRAHSTSPLLVAAIEKPVIAAINGDALGQGLELALGCDIRLASDKARFGFPQLTKAIIPNDGGTQRLARLVGRGKALELVLTAETITAPKRWKSGW